MLRTLSLLLLLVCAPAFGEEDNDEPVNPWLDAPTGELEALLDDIPEIMEERWYRVELFVFARPEQDDDEQWREDRYPAYPSISIRPAGFTEEKEEEEDNDADRNGGDGENDRTSDREKPLLPDGASDLHKAAAEHGAWRKLDEELELEEARERMERDGYRSLFHRAWRQPVGERDQALPLYIEGGRSMPLMLEPETLEMLPGTDKDDDEEPAPGVDNDVPLSTDPSRQILEVLLPAEPEMRGTLLLHRGRFLHLEPSLWMTIEEDDRRYHLDIQQRRRMRSEELHYLDHPRFGLLLRLDPWDHPLQEKREQLEQALEVQEGEELP